MRWRSMREIGGVLASLLLLIVPTIAYSQAEQPKPAPPPIAQELIREGDFAVRLQSALGLGTGTDEAEAESRLGEAGIIPRNGWIADYPVTPDIVGELQKSVGDAADAGKISMGRDAAVQKVNEVAAGADLPVTSHTAAKTYEPLPEAADQYPNPTVINNYYYEEGPPVVTYYAPPPDFYYLYAWVPYPFWWYGFWFPGFFVLNDFHRPIFVGNRWCFVSNHFNDVRVNRVYRIDPVRRFNGRTYAGIGVTNRRGFISTGVPRSAHTIFNAPRTRGAPGGRSFAPSSPGGRSYGAPPRGGRSYGAPPRGGRSAPSSRGSRSFSAPPQGGRSSAPSSRGGGMAAPRSGGGFSGRGERR